MAKLCLKFRRIRAIPLSFATKHYRALQDINKQPLGCYYFPDRRTSRFGCAVTFVVFFLLAEGKMDTDSNLGKKSKAEHSENLHPFQPLIAILLISALVFACVLFYPSKISEQFNFPSISFWHFNHDSSPLTEAAGEKLAKDQLTHSSFVANDQVNLGQLLLELANAKSSSASRSYGKPMGQGA
ncbi:hypothetical protein SG34_023670 [Thalassomonas viridans]|uniref:Uncharacterized protein n=1 Tax=Thalassomonas viridans TaxID=137584 RepID=A0AAE9Z1J1_9GAMM|nr:hypothetical protein [Thalassomonas viridans]WDE04310.1 hypothetical protein SG34_023670 [Thalassomonas viridans]